MILLFWFCQSIECSCLQFDDEYFHDEFMISLSVFAPAPNHLPQLSTNFNFIRNLQFFPFEDHINEMCHFREKIHSHIELHPPISGFPVQLFQLKNDVDLNGQFGLIQSFVSTSAKYFVKLCKDKSRKILVNRANLKILKVVSQRWKIKLMDDRIDDVVDNSIFNNIINTGRMDVRLLQTRPSLSKEKIVEILIQNDWKICDAMDMAVQCSLEQGPMYGPFFPPPAMGQCV